MKYVYIIRSISDSESYYTGITSDLKQRLEDHNTGKSSHTEKNTPWELVTYVAFNDPQKAWDFENYLKSGSGRAFSNKHFR